MMIDESKFKKKPWDGFYRVRVEFSGECWLDVKAETENEAKEKAQKIIDENELDVVGTDIEDVKITSARKSPEMFLVKRNGTNVICVSHLQEGDEPRDFDEHGF